MSGTTTSIVRTQDELDAALWDPDVGRIQIESTAGVLLTLAGCGSTIVEARGSGLVVARGSAALEAYDRVTVAAYDTATVAACDRVTVEACDRVTVWAYDTATVKASDSATVIAHDTSTVVVRGLMVVVERGSATVVARGYVVVSLFSRAVTVRGGVAIDVARVDLRLPGPWCEYHSVATDAGTAVVFKAVDKDLVAGQLHTPTTYQIGSVVTAPDWNPTRRCGHGLHFGPTPAQAARCYQDDSSGEVRFLACEIKVDGAVPLGDKIKAESCRVLHEVDASGARVSGEWLGEKTQMGRVRCS